MPALPLRSRVGRGGGADPPRRRGRAAVIAFGMWGALTAAGVGLGGCAAFDFELNDPVGGTGGLASGGASAVGGTGGGEAAASGGDVSGGNAGAPAGLMGWAAIADCGPNGTTGGEGGPTITPITVTELIEAAAAPGAGVISIAGTFDLGGALLDVSSDKTVVGGGDAVILGAVRLRDVTNVVLRNIRFDGAPTSDTTDALEVTGATCVWIDHCEFIDGADGNLDLVRGADLITVSWSRFAYVAKTDEHRFSSLCGNTDADTPGKLNVTFHHNWWAEGVLAQMPRVRHGKVHIFNNFYSAAGNDYCIGAGYMARLLVENNVFDGVNDPIRFQLDEEEEGSGIHTAEVVEVGNDYANATGEHVALGAAFEPPYPYSLQSAAAARESVVAAAGRE